MRTRRACVLALVVAVLLSTASCRNPGTASKAGTSVDDLARDLAGSSGDDVAKWQEELRAANGGGTTIDDQVAQQLRSRTATIDAIWDATNEVSGLACQVWSSGGDQVLADGVTPLATQVDAQTLLNQMNSDVDAGSVAAESISFACDLKEVADSGL